MCMPRLFGMKIIDGEKEAKKPVKTTTKKTKTKIIYQSKVKFESSC